MLLHTLRQIFELDTRALALCRIVMGSLTLLAVAQSVPNAAAFYSDDGFMPREGLLRYLGREGAINFYLFGGGVQWAYLLLGATMLAAVSFIAGFHTRVSTLILWLLIISAQNRNPMILHGGDVMFRVLLFWSLFLPMGGRWSMDARRAAGLPLFAKRADKGDNGIPQLYFGVGSVAFMLQVAAIYMVTSQTKTGLAWHTHGTAVQLALLNPEYTMPVGTWFVSKFDPMLKLMTYGTIWAELLLPLLLFSPWKTHLVRLLGMAGLVALHVGIDVTMSVGYTSLAVFSGLLALTPPVVFNTVGSVFGKRRQADSAPLRITGMRPRWAEVLCGFCLAFVFIVNLKTLGYPGSREVLQVLPKFPINMLRLDQRWTMFSPHPPLYQSYILARGHLADGSIINMRTRELLRGNASLPPYMRYFDNHRWRKYLTNLAKEEMGPLRPYYGKYLADSWNEDKTGGSPDRVTAVTLWHVRTPLLEDDAQTSWTELVHYDVTRNEAKSGAELADGDVSLVETLPR